MFRELAMVGVAEGMARGRGGGRVRMLGDGGVGGGEAGRRRSVRVGRAGARVRAIVVGGTSVNAPASAEKRAEVVAVLESDTNRCAVGWRRTREWARYQGQVPVLKSMALGVSRGAQLQG